MMRRRHTEEMPLAGEHDVVVVSVPDTEAEGRHTIAGAAHLEVGDGSVVGGAFVELLKPLH